MSQSDPIGETLCSTAEELISVLRPEHPKWHRARRTWAFRGHACASWQLEPKAFRAFRESRWCDYLPKRRIASTDTPLIDQLGNEYEAFSRFLRLADRSGLYVAGMETVLRPGAKRDLQVTVSNWSWPPSSVIEPLALAQHHGVPTRLLDFTDDPMVAAFFAAESAMILSPRKRRGDNFLAVWAVNLLFLEQVWPEETWNLVRPSGILPVRVSTARNSYLNAQQAFFLHDVGSNDYFEAAGEFRPMDDVISKKAMDDDTWAMIGRRSSAVRALCQPPSMRKLLLPVTEADHLLELLYQEGISYARLMPTLDNVSRTLDLMRARSRGAF